MLPIHTLTKLKEENIMKEREVFAEPEVEIIRFPEQDIITTSGGETTSGGGSGIVLPDDEW